MKIILNNNRVILYLVDNTIEDMKLSQLKLET